MLGSSRTSDTALQKFLAARYDESLTADTYAAAGRDLFAIVTVLADERPLRAMLADSAISDESKTATINTLFASQVSELAVAVLTQVVTSRWSSEADMVDAVEEAGQTLILMGAEVDGDIDRVEEELFRFGRAIDANAALQMALTDPATPAKAKAAIVTQLLSGKAAQPTIELVAQVSGNLRGRRIQNALTRLSELAAARRGRIVADVRTAIELTDQQQERLRAVLARLHGRSVELNIDVDPAVIGGVEVRVGDEVIDGTAASKLEQARRRMTS
jgi:F-type H+-transporting ATPase subunit delta